LPDPWFFLSYSTTDDSPYLTKFYEDLALEVRRLAALRGDMRPKDIGFIDVSSIQTGEFWDNALLNALRSSRMLVCLYSRGYFGSEYCGKEFQIFMSRVAKYAATLPKGQKQPRLIMPVLWDPPDWLPQRLPEIITRIQFTHADFGQVYAEKGLLYLLKMGRYADDYQQFLDSFARALVRDAEQHTLPHEGDVPPLAEVLSAFHASAPAVGLDADLTPENVGPGAAQFVFVAGRDQELRSVRNRIDAYGSEGGRDWRPFLPDVSRAVGIISQGAAAREDLFYEQLPVGQDLLDKLRIAERTNTIVLFVVDPWSADLQHYRQRLQEYDQLNFINCGILVPWNERDDEMANSSDRLRYNIRQTFYRTFMANSTYIRDSIGTVDELERELIAAINDVRRRIVQHAEVMRPVAAGEAKPLPQISGPGGDSQ
jgi:FxsC-like protein